MKRKIAYISPLLVAVAVVGIFGCISTTSNESPAMTVTKYIFGGYSDVWAEIFYPNQIYPSNPGMNNITNANSADLNWSIAIYLDYDFSNCSLSNYTLTHIMDAEFVAFIFTPNGSIVLVKGIDYMPKIEGYSNTTAKEWSIEGKKAWNITRTTYTIVVVQLEEKVFAFANAWTTSQTFVQRAVERLSYMIKTQKGELESVDIGILDDIPKNPKYVSFQTNSSQILNGTKFMYKAYAFSEVLEEDGDQVNARYKLIYEFYNTTDAENATQELKNVAERYKQGTDSSGRNITSYSVTRSGKKVTVEYLLTEEDFLTW